MAPYKSNGYVDPNWPDPNGPHDAHIIIYGYVPSLALCILGIAFFSLFFLAHTAQAIRYRTWSFIPLTSACSMEVIGYAFRLLSSQKDPYNIIYFVLAYFFIVTAPVLISASIYVCLTKLMRWAAAQSQDQAQDQDPEKPNTNHTLPLPNPKLVLYTFITADIISTILQLAGASLIGVRTSAHEDPTTANNILLAGLAFQSAAFIIFLTLFAAVTRTLLQRGIFRPKAPFIVAVAIAALLIFARTLFRLAETAEGVFGYASVHEAFFGGLECAPVVLAVGVLAVWHPGRWMGSGAVVAGRR